MFRKDKGVDPVELVSSVFEFCRGGESNNAQHTRYLKNQSKI